MAYDRECTNAEASRCIPLADIDRGDERFRITTRRDSDDLKPSIHRFGLQTPPLVSPVGAGFIIVSGFRRVSACASLRWDSIPARVTRPGAGAYECVLRAVAENSLERPLNLIETSRALNLMEQNAGGGRIPPEDAVALGLPSHPEMISRLKRLCRMPAAIQAAVLDGALSFTMACDLGSMEEGLGTAFARLFHQLKPSLNKQREIVSLVVEIAGREAVDPSQVLEDAFQARDTDAAGQDRNQDIQTLRSRLRKRRFPALTAAEKNFLTLRQRLKLGEAVQLTPPRDFEGTRFILTLNFETLEDVARLRDKLDQLVEHPDFKVLLTGKTKGFDGASGT
jgi:ParB family transcriptional regulator, chromosome partitioning protein